jgi:hypothetical protein
MRRLAAIASLVALAFGLAGFQNYPYQPPYPHSGGGVTWTLVQGSAAGTHNFTCTSTACSVTVSSTTAGNLEIFLWAAFAEDTATPLTSNAATGDTFTHCPGFPQQYEYNPPNWTIADCFYAVSAAGGATTFTITPTWTGGESNVASDVQFLEVHRSTGTATYDTDNVAENNSCTSCTAPSLTVSGTDYVAEFGDFNQTVSAISGSYTNPANFDTTNAVAGFAGNLSVSSYSAPSWTVSSAPNSGASMGVVAFK